jgi:hypothetical protein
MSRADGRWICGTVLKRAVMKTSRLAFCGTISTPSGALDGVHFFCAGSGQLQYLPTVALPLESIHQVWCLEAQTRRWKLDIMLEPGTAEEWTFRRDSSIRRQRPDMIGRTDEGMPNLKPAGVLLFKTKHLRGKDELDFENALGKLGAEERAWLKTALNHSHPRHGWISLL